MFVAIVGIWKYYDSKRVNKIIKKKNEELQEARDDLLETNLELQMAKDELLKKNKELLISKEILQETNEELQTAQKTFKNLLYGTSEPILLIHDEKFISCNNAAMELLGCRKKWEILNSSPSDISPPNQPDGQLSKTKWDEMMQKCMDEGKNRFQWVYLKNDNEEFWCDVNLTKINIDYRDMIHVTWRDITLEKSLQKELEKLVVTDRLTKIYNRHKLDEVLEHSKELADRYGSPFGIIILDIDHFKQVNDTHGHQGGDVALVEFAFILRRYSRKTDIVGRYGGEEFLIVAPQANEESIMLFAQKLQEHIRKYNFNIVGKLTASMGISIYAEYDSVDTLLSRADEALYEAKENGRDCIYFK